MLPKKLEKGDLIRIVCPSGYLKISTTSKLKEILEKWGYRVQLGSTVGWGNGYFAGSDEDRRIDLQLALDDPEVKAIIMGRGGYGMSRIIDDLDWSYFNHYPKWLVGFSDVTVLLNHCFKRMNVITVHGPMALQFDEANSFSANKALWNLQKIFSHTWDGYHCKIGNPLNKWGYTEGYLVGGNLSLINHLIGTTSAIDFQDKILFIEDVGEYTYSIDRLLIQLKRLGVFEQIKGLIVGQFTNIKDTIRPFGKEVNEIISSYIQDAGIPVFFEFPAGHEEVNYPLLIGAKYQMKVHEGGMNLIYSTEMSSC